MMRALEPATTDGVRDDAVFLTTVSRILPGQSRSRITQPRLISTRDRPSLAAQDDFDPNNRLISFAEIAEFEDPVDVSPVVVLRRHSGPPTIPDMIELLDEHPA